MINPVQKELYPAVRDPSEESEHLLLLRIMHRIESYDFARGFI